MKKIILVLFAIVFVGGIVSAYILLVPRSLGITPSEAANTSLLKKTNGGLTFKELPASNNPAQSISFSGSKAINADFTSEELTTFLARSKWEYNLLRNAQVRINADGTAEVSGKLPLDLLSGFAASSGASTAPFEKYLGTAARLGVSPGFSIKISGNITNNAPTLTIHKIQAGPAGVPADVLSQNTTQINAAIGRMLSKIPGLSVQSLDFKNGTMNYRGTMPAVISREVRN